MCNGRSKLCGRNSKFDLAALSGYVLNAPVLSPVQILFPRIKKIIIMFVESCSLVIFSFLLNLLNSKISHSA